MDNELPHPIPGATADAPHYRTAAPSISLLIRVAEGRDRWANTSATRRHGIRDHGGYHRGPYA